MSNDILALTDDECLEMWNITMPYPLFETIRFIYESGYRAGQNPPQLQHTTEEESGEIEMDGRICDTTTDG